LAQFRAADPHDPAVVSADPADPLPVLTDPGVEDTGELPRPLDRDGWVDALDGVCGPVAVRVVLQLELGRLVVRVLLGQGLAASVIRSVQYSRGPIESTEPCGRASRVR
jgi:hypothetical protein